MYEEKVSAKSGKKKNENFALVAGFGLIVLVIIFTLFRSNLFSDSSESDTRQDSQTDRSATPPSYETISANELNKKIMSAENKAGLTLLDIRPFESYIAEHLIDAVNVPLDEFPVSTKIDAHSLVVVVGKDAADEDISAAVDKLKQENYKDIIVLAGGMDSWKQLIGATVTYGDPKSFVDQSKVSYLDPQQLNDALSQQVPVYIIDVRSGDEYAKGHIAGAKNIPFEELEKRRSEIAEKKIVVVGDNELQEFQASVQMYDMLLVSPYVMRTAMPGWKDKGFALVK